MSTEISERSDQDNHSEIMDVNKFDNTNKYKDIVLKLQEVFVNLKIISKIKHNEKLTIVDNLLTIDNSCVQCVSRWCNGDNRNASTDYITHVVDEAFRYCNIIINNELEGIRENTIINDDHSTVLQRLTFELGNCITGLIIIKMTYSDDSLIQSKLDFIIENIRNKIQRNNKLIKINVE